jgi:hypothetical protein
MYFLGLPVENFSMSLGYNSNPSTLQLSLVEDPEEGQLWSPGTDNAEHHFTGNPGMSAMFELPEIDGEPNPAKFAGFIQSWRRTTNMNGQRIQVTLADPRIVFPRIPTITDYDSSPAGENTTFNNPIIDFYGYYEGRGEGVVGQDWNIDGMTWVRMFELLQGWNTRMYGSFITFQIDPTFYNRVHNNYRPNLQNPTLSELFDTVAKENGMDWYIDVVAPTALRNPEAPGGIGEVREMTIIVKGIQRAGFISLQDSQGLLANQDIDLFRLAKDDRVKSYDEGKELRLDPNNVILWGSKRRTLFSTFERSDAHRPIPIYNKLNDGTYVERPFISLENLTSKDVSLINNLPWVNFQKKTWEVEISTDTFTDANGRVFAPLPKYKGS